MSIGANADVASLGTLASGRTYTGYAAYGITYGSKALLLGTVLTPPLAYELYYYDANAAGSLAKVSAGGAAPPGSPTAAAVEFYHTGLDHYFITWVADEIAELDAGTQIRGWTRTGQSIKVLTGAQAGASPVCRIYIPPGKGDGHFFGRDANECDGTMTKNPTFVLESAAFFHLYPPNLGTCAPGTVPVYRVFSNRPDANHRYTTDRATRDLMQSRGWLAEGDGPDTVVMCAPA